MKNLLMILILAVVLVGCNAVQGPQGVAGSNGVGCSVQSIAASSAAPNGGSNITCGSTQSLVLNGAPGAAGTVVVPVQFCAPGTAYPSTFSEVGFCIGGQLYAVYSANDGFLALIPPGVYSSNGINSSCTFTVGANCAVGRQ